MIKRLTASIVLIISLMSWGLAASQPIFAATAKTPVKTTVAGSTGQALEIAPPVIYLRANPGQTITTKLFLRNVSKGKLLVSGTANDFTASGEDGTPKVILDEDTSNNPYSLKDWVTVPSKLLIIPREIKTMTITISVPRLASPGGHYGVLRFTGTPPELEGTGVSLSASLGALILLTVNGKAAEKMSVADFYVTHNDKKGSFFQSGPVGFTERLQNSGNIHEQPVGQVTIKNMFGKKFAAVNVNLPPRSILPGSIRRFTQPLDKAVIGNKRLFGRYTAQLSVTYGVDKQVLSAQISFWVIPIKMISIIVISIVVLFFVLRFALKKYNRYILKKGQR